jgi:hypothetical protein
MNDEYKYQLWASEPFITAPLPERTEYLGWELILQTDDPSELFVKTEETKLHYKRVKITQTIKLQIEVAGSNPNA